jgi:hypothetical protein
MRVVEIQNGDSTSKIEFDANGTAVRYTDANGEVFTNKGPQGENQSEYWESNNPVSKGAYIEVQGDYSVRMTDLGTNHVVTRTVNGIETVAYRNGGTTTTKVDGNTEWISIEDKNRPGMRLMKMERDEKGAKLAEYTDRDLNVFVRTEKRTDGDEEYQQKPIFNKRDANGNLVMEERDGQLVPAEFTVSADRTGNVCVRKFGHESDADYAVREFNNGTRITSNGHNTERTLSTADGLVIADKTPQNWPENAPEGQAKTRTITYPNGNQLTLTYGADGKVAQVNGMVDGASIDRKSDDSSQITESNGQVSWTVNADSSNVIGQDGSQKLISGKVPPAADLTESKIIAKVPPDIDLNKNIEEARMHPVGYGEVVFETGRAFYDMWWFRSKVKYGAEWDFKAPGGEYITNKEYEAYGNWHYGVTGAAAKWSEVTLLKEAGAAQQAEKTSKSEYGNPGIGVPGLRIYSDGNYGDEPEDQQRIREGYEWYQQQLAEKSTQAAA